MPPSGPVAALLRIDLAQGTLTPHSACVALALCDRLDHNVQLRVSQSSTAARAFAAPLRGPYCTLLKTVAKSLLRGAYAAFASPSDAIGCADARLHRKLARGRPSSRVDRSCNARARTARRRPNHITAAPTQPSLHTDDAVTPVTRRRDTPTHRRSPARNARCTHHLPRRQKTP